LRKRGVEKEREGLRESGRRERERERGGVAGQQAGILKVRLGLGEIER
jgi:hypothetical protein